ncbi:peptidoglycan-binding domain-containing protein [Actinomyces qiguomingii]|uniref:peptidoglycan-binding domain-containing protein n=1 Tax=Actinomyces qiguomingii TaxID=2057800 RepID=UPI000CA08F49|nr:peptidoglycan-binding domain-containing protein [Actinomyces qiguomingii]
MTETEPSRHPGTEEAEDTDDAVSARDGGYRSWLTRRWLLVLIVVALVSGAAGTAAGLLLKSPADIAAGAQAPTPSLITAEVDERVLVDSFSIDVELESEQSISVGPTGQTQQGTAGDQEDDGDTGSAGGNGTTTTVITKLPVSVGDEVSAGTIVLELSGRPIIALAGAIPSYRDLAPGASGPDVTQLQQALVAQGLLSDSAVDGTYGSATSGAVSQLYSRLGYTASATDGGSGEDAKALRNARAAVRQAQDAVTTAEQEDGSGAADSTSLSTAQAALADARADLADVEARIGVVLPRSEVVFIPGGSATVLSVSGQVGQEASGQEILSLGAGDLVLRGKTVADQAATLSVGATANIDVLGDGATCSVTALDAADTGRTQVTIGCDTDLDPAALAGTVVARLTRETTGTSVLCVPIGAISEHGDGTTTVITLTGTDTLTRVEVTVGLEADGYVEIRPNDPDAVTRDSVVIVGGR